MNKRLHIFIFLCIAILAKAEPLTLDSCLQLAKQNNYQIHAAQFEVAKAQEIKKQAFTKYFPQVAINSMGYYSLEPLVRMDVKDVIDHCSSTMAREYLQTWYTDYGEELGLNSSFNFFKNGVLAGVTATQPIFVGGQIVNGNRLATLGVEAASLKAEITERDLLQNVEENFWLVIGLEDKQQTLEAAKTLIDTIENTVKIAVQAGIAIQNDLLRVQLKRNELSAKELQLRHGLTLARQALCLTIGIDYTDSLQLIKTHETQDISTTHTTLRPETQLLDLQIRAATLQKKMEMGKALPQVAVGASYAYHNLLDKNMHNGIGFVTIHIPLTDWWETSHKLREKQYAIEQATEQREYLQNQMDLQIVQLYQQTLEAQEQIRIANLSVAQCEENMRLTQLNYRAGRQTVSELLEAQSILLQAQNALTDAQLQYAIAKHQYERLK